MKILVDSGIVNARRDGKWTRYSLSDEGIEKCKKRQLIGYLQWIKTRQAAEICIEKMHNKGNMHCKHNECRR